MYACCSCWTCVVHTCCLLLHDTIGPHGELGYGEKKSSAKPDFIQNLDSCRIRDLACGQGITLFAIAEEDADDKKAIKKLPVLDAKDVASLES